MAQLDGNLDDPFLLLLRKQAIQIRERQGVPFSQSKGAQDWPKRLLNRPSPIEFQQIIERHLPVLIDECLADRPGLANWKDTSYLKSRMGPDRDVVVAITPDGRADDLITHPELHEPVFALPLEENMPFSELLDRLATQTQAKSDTIAYLQSQNSNLRVQDYGDLSPLLQDLEIDTNLDASDAGSKKRSDLVWATEAIGYAPEATNLWIGTSASRTSMHRDYYENLFTVVRGWKEFTLYPPTESYFLCDDEEYPVYKYVKDQGQLKLERDAEGSTTRWIPIDPTLPTSADRNAPFVHRDLNLSAKESMPSREHTYQTKYGYALPALRIRVHEGETLYLPSGWFHHVAQQQDQQLVDMDGHGVVDRGLCLCLNWWYEISDDVAIQLEETNLTVPIG
nr:clavaminate synthase-like protein [Melanopsichium pennsylvanicum 4]